ncbi:MAG TPA: ribosome maturation factor RimM [Longimicrobiales bacterium]|nr:ribosome maturation factor RimM [Longimicrobiales bacterium]
MTEPGGERAAPAHLVVGFIAKAHGTRGELFVAPLTDHPDAVFAPGQSLLLGDEKGALAGDAPSLVVDSVRPFKRGLLVAFENVAGRDGADALARRYVLVPSEAVPAAAEDEVFYHELLGMRVETVAGEVAGTVREVFETEPHHLLEVVNDEGHKRLVPFAARLVRSIDREGRRIIIDPPEGLLDL